ncbi:baseplate J/gp47 family protein [Streptomyces sp. ME02-8801-2C]|uniref:baseplate J/gp47 family protein n=1 Tax=Streptomyces sp. ME02-8801-2C TaxID=3028680 RepID=UPI0029AC8AD0|nr:baseplate J/gp47 family protein [Streptomyces sp. ME02-8801-2C]MDX3452469.1 baseplate J/gp47 family protein [Streptomyces sp. ME02-8801-2C]
MTKPPATPPAIDYTDKDFRSLRDAMLRLARLRLPEWTDESPADLGMLMVDLFAYAGDVMLYYQDRIASELFPGTATERQSVVDLLRLIGYELSPAVPAVADLLLTFTRPTTAQRVRVAHGTRFASRSQDGAAVLEYVYLGPDLDLDLLSDQLRPGDDPDLGPVVHYDGLPVEQSVAVDDVVLGSSTGEPNQTFRLPDPTVVVDSVVVQVNEGAGWVTWDRRDSLLFDISADGRAVFSHPEARHYQLLIDGTGTAHVVFGAGRRPPVGLSNVRASYRVCRGAAGNLGAGAITQPLTPVPSLRAVVNPQGAAGGGDAERTDHAAKYAPFAFRSTNRAVTTSDYVALAHSTGTVAKARAYSASWNRIDLYVAPAGDSFRPVPEALRHRLIGYFEDKRMAGTLVRVLDAQAVPVDITIELLTDERFVSDAVASHVETAIAGLLAFDRVDFAQTLYQSDFYAVAEAVPGVLSSTITTLRRADRPPADLDAELARHNLPPLAELPPFLREAALSNIATEGRIDIGEFEIPVLGALDVRVRTGAV